MLIIIFNFIESVSFGQVEKSQIKFFYCLFETLITLEYNSKCLILFATLR